MVLPISSPYPSLTNPVTFRAAAALPAAGAWDATPTIIACPDMRYVSFYLSYTRGAAGGAFDFQLWGSPYSANALVVQSWFAMSLKANGALAAGADVQSRAQREYVTYQATGAAIENFYFGVIDIAHTIERLYIQARESGVVGNPGTLHVVGVLNLGE